MPICLTGALCRDGSSTRKNFRAGSAVLYRQLGSWELYKTRIIGYALVMLALVLLSGYLLFERRRRKQAEVSLQSSFVFEQLISELSTYFIDLPTDKIDAGIDEALNRLRAFLSVDRVTYVRIFCRTGQKCFEHTTVLERGCLPLKL